MFGRAAHRFPAWLTVPLLVLGAAGAGAAMYFVTGLLFFVAMILVTNPPFRDRSFDSDAWKQSPGSETRYRMYDDLEDDHLRIGLPRAEVLAMLGPDCQCGYFRDWDLVYNMGPEPGLFRIDSIWLVVRFDEEDRVAEFRTVTD